MTQTDRDVGNGRDREKEQRGVKRPVVPAAVPEPLQDVTNPLSVSGDQAYVNHTGCYSIHWPICRGHLNIHSGPGGSLTASLVDLETIWSHALQKLLEIPLKDLKYYRCILLIPDIYNRQHVKEVVHMLLVKMGFSGMSLKPSSPDDPITSGEKRQVVINKLIHILGGLRMGTFLANLIFVCTIPEETSSALLSRKTVMTQFEGKALGVDKPILHIIDSCASDEMKRKMYSCILVVGGGLLFHGAQEFLQHHSLNKMPPSFHRLVENVDVITRPKDMDPCVIAWKGGAMLACLDTTQELWIHQREWQRFGVRMLCVRAAFVR
ncbi:actin-related protein 8 [Cyprinus carpio]|uniref:Actin-related protein 8 n=1 Tax=Cyprinus carpio TaxID=7962 RepID=A0A9Q9YBX8_CYPCA|nr:actin-related protein 8 [Cyprinus carpio]